MAPIRCTRWPPTQAAELLRLFADHVGAAEFEPLSTTGVPLATRQDWRELLAAAAKLGTTTVWTAFHGIGVEHDRQVNRAGAFTETCLAVQRVHAAGLRAGCNVFLTKASAPQAERLLDALQRLEIDGMWWGPATYIRQPGHAATSTCAPSHRTCARSLPGSGSAACSTTTCGPTSSLEDYTEAAWARRALAGDWPTWRRYAGDVLELVCRPNLDLHTGVAGWYRERHGNLRTDGPHAVLGRALEQGGRSFDAL